MTQSHDALRRAQLARRQTTLKNAIHCSGTPIHNGGHVTMAMLPAPAGHGIVFRRTDIAGRGVVIPADWNHVADMPMCTALEAEGVQIATVEHLMAALSGCGIDNLLIEINGPELPIMDGSAWPFVFLIECAGITELDAPRRFLKILSPVSVSMSGRSASLLPGEGFTLRFEVDYDSGAIARQTSEMELVDGTFKNELSRARTYGFLHEVDALRAAGLLKSMSNPARLVILCQLAEGERSVGELERAVGLSQSGISQHLAVLRRGAVVCSRRVGQTVLYSLASRDVTILMATLHDVFCGKAAARTATPTAARAKIRTA